VEVGEEVIEIFPYVIEQLKPAVQFSCATSPTPTEDGLEADLAGSDTPSRLTALGRLLELEAPHSVALQYSALRELERSHGDHEAVRLAHTRFSSDWIENALRTAPPAGRFGRAEPRLTWAIRAAGVTRNEKSIPRLLELSRCDNLDV
jgi:hypothetical protein